MTPSSSINHLDCQPRTNCYCEFVMFKKVGVFKMFFSYHLSYLTIPIISPLPKFTFSSVSHDLNSKFHYAKHNRNFEETKVKKKKKKWSTLTSFWKPEACGQTDRSILIVQKLVENAKMPKFKCDILGNFQTLWMYPNKFWI